MLARTRRLAAALETVTADRDQLRRIVDEAREQTAAFRHAGCIALDLYAATDTRVHRTTARLLRALRACARYRAALAAEARRADQLQARLDDALVLNSAAVTAGSDWQKRRPDTDGSLA